MYCQSFSGLWGHTFVGNLFVALIQYRAILKCSSGRKFMGKVHPRNPLIFSLSDFFYNFLKQKTKTNLRKLRTTQLLLSEIYMFFSYRKFQTHNPSSETTINLIPAAVWLLIDLKGENSPEEVPPIICPQQVKTKSLLFLSFKINKWNFIKTM